MTDPGSRRLKVLLLTAAMTAGGSQRYLSILLNHLDRDAFELQLATISDTRVEYTLPEDVLVHIVMSEECAQPGVASLSPPDITELFVGDAAWVPSVADRIVTLVRRLQPDVVVCTPEHTAVLAAVASQGFPAHTRLLCRIPALPSKAFPRTGAGAGYSALARRVLRLADMTAVNSPAIARELADEFGIGHDDIAVMQNPIDIGGIRRLAALPVDEVEMGDGIPTVVFTGRLERIKGLEYLLQAVAEVAAETPLRCVLVGEGSQRGYLCALSKHLGIADIVHFVGQQDNPFRFMGKATLFVLPSLSEGMPNVLVEAMACGTPVIATDIEGGVVRELLAGECGIVVPREDAGALAAAMLDMLSDGLSRERLVACGTSRAALFDLPATIAQSADALIAAAARPERVRADIPSGDRVSPDPEAHVDAAVPGQVKLATRADRIGGIARVGGLRGLATHTRAWLGVRWRRLRPGTPARRTSAPPPAPPAGGLRTLERIRVTVLVPSMSDGFIGEGLQVLLAGLDRARFDVAVASLYAPIAREDLPEGAVGHAVPSVAVDQVSDDRGVDPDVISRNQAAFREMTSLARGFAELADAVGTDIVYAVGFYAGTLAMMARTHMSTRTPCVLCVPTTMRQIADATAHPELYSALMRALAPQADAVVVPDESIRSDIEREMPPLSGVLEVIPSPVVVPRVAVSTPGSDAPSGHRSVVTRIETGDADALRCLADAMVAVRRWEDLRCVVFGEESLAAVVAAMRDERELGDSLRYAGSEPHDDIWPTAAAYVNPTTVMVREHTQGVLRAVVAGCPVVSSRLSTADSRLLSAHGARGALTTPGDAMGIADAILQYVWDDDERRVAVEGARRNLDAVSADTGVPKFERLLQAIFTESRGGVTPV